MAFAYDNRSSVESGGTRLVLRFNADAATRVEPQIIAGSGSLTVTVAGSGRTPTLERIVQSGYGPFFAEYSLSGSAVTAGQAVTATGTASLLIDSTDPTAVGTEAFTDTNVHNDVSPSSENTITTLVSAATVKAYLGITVTDYDTLITRLTKVATRAIKRYCNRSFIQEPRLEVYNGEGAESITLREIPVRRVVSVYLTDGFCVTNRLDPSDWSLNPRDGVLRFRDVARGPREAYPGARVGAFHGPMPAFGDQACDVVVDYTGGYTTVPEDLEQVACEFTAYLFRERTRDPVLLSESIGDYSYTRASDLLTRANATGVFSYALNAYKRFLL